MTDETIVVGGEPGDDPQSTDAPSRPDAGEPGEGEAPAPVEPTTEIVVDATPDSTKSTESTDASQG